MKNAIRILRSQRGETLVESIVSFALIVVALLSFTAMVALGMQLNGRALHADSASGSVSVDAGSAVVTVTSGAASSTYDVSLVQNEDGTVSGYDAASARERK